MKINVTFIQDSHATDSNRKCDENRIINKTFSADFKEIIVLFSI